MMSSRSSRLVLTLFALAMLAFESAYAATTIDGELRRWHPIALTFDGPSASEHGEVNPFLDFRLDVTFSHTESGARVVVPGYFAADGSAANTGADSGNKWRVHLYFFRSSLSLQR